ncbi:MAG: leucine-rich repeat domain-containing protein [Candidatus Hermodarchaeota archaeon]
MTRQTPLKIFEELNNNILDKQSAIQNLIALIENSPKISHRLESLKILRKISINFGKFEGNRDTLRDFLENLLISDTDELIRNEAALILSYEYKEDALEPLRWALHHEESPLCLHTIFDSLINIVTSLTNKKEPTAKLILIHEIKLIKEKDFRIGFEVLKSTNKTEDFNSEKLASIVKNYYSILYLTKSYWRLKYKVEKCKIIELDFMFKGLTKLPEAVKHLTNLRKLVLRYNQITEIPDWIESLHALESLNLNVNNINKLPLAIGSLDNLKELLLWKNELQDLPNSICSLRSLKTLNLRLNYLKRLPSNIGDLINLTDLNLHDNKLTQIPDSISLLKSLETLNLSWNLLSNLTQSITNLSSLKSLDLERNELIRVPISIDSLTSLEILNLGDNKLESIPESIGNLRKLRILNLSRNRLSNIPQSILNLHNLEELYLSENNLNINFEFVKAIEKMGAKVFL